MKKKIILVVTLAFLSWLTIKRLSVSSCYFDTGASYLVYPTLAMQRAIVKPLSEFFKSKQAYQDLKQQLLLAQQQVEQLRAENVQLQAAQHFFEQIHELVEFKQQYKTEQAQLAQVLLKNISPQEQFWLVDAGSNKGIKEDMVAVWNNCLVGRVVQVFPWYSKIVLVTDKRCKVAVYGANHQAMGIHEGCNQEDKSCVQHVSHLSSIDIGELIISSGQGLVFPQGFAVGTVTSFMPGQLFHEIAVKPLIDLQVVEYCYLIKKGS